MAVDRYDFGGLIFSANYEYTRMERILCNRAQLYRGQPRLLTLIRDNQGCTLKELSELSGIGMPSLSVSVRNMKRASLLQMDTGKTKELRLTEQGLIKAEAFHKEIDRMFQQLLGNLDENDVEDLNKSLHYLVGFFRSYDPN